ncbi:3-deoxy-D-manno-octulosonic acid transferase [Rhizobium sp. CRIBSB]|nr:3-deoxy-D-manno-octulosonic acid transferase [Rhizobium sp. CRIBSB]
MSLALTAYRLLTGILEPFAPRLLDARAKRGKEDPGRVDERLGLTRTPRPGGPLVWLHGVSVGETLSMLPLVEHLRTQRPDVTILVTSGTVTSAQLLARRLPADAIHQYAPIDGPEAVAAFLDHWKPSAGVLVESELWPNLIMAAWARDIPLILASARITQKAANGWSRFPRAAQTLTRTFRAVLAQDDISASRLSAMGARDDGRVNLKLAGGPLPCDMTAFTTLSAAVGDRQVVVAASTHPGEEIAIVRALDRLTERLCLILVPRHPDRADEIAQVLSRDGHRFALRSRGDQPGPDTDLYIADTLGEMGLFLRLADVVVMGGSFGPALGFEPLGGHNPLEPARLGKAAITGPDSTNWLEVTDALIRAGGLLRVQAPSDLPAVITPLLADPDNARLMGDRARRAAAEAGSGLETLVGFILPLLPAAPARRGRR